MPRIALNSKMRLSTTHSPRRAGATVVEVAVVLPLVFLMFFSAVEVSQLNSLQHSAQAAAYEGARRAIIPGASAAQAQQASNELLNAVATRGATVSINPPVIVPATRQVTVTVSVPFKQNTLVASKFFQRATLTSACTLNREVSE